MEDTRQAYGSQYVDNTPGQETTPWNTAMAGRTPGESAMPSAMASARNGAAGIIPGADLADLLVEVYDADAGGDAARADELFRRVLPMLVFQIQQSIDPQACGDLERLLPLEKETLINGVARRNVLRTIEMTLGQSQTLGSLVREGRVMIVGAMYDVVTGDIDFLPAIDAPALGTHPSP